jgi:hypothetical protein
MLTEDERRAIVESGKVYLSDGLRAQFAGIKDPVYCGVHSAREGFWACSWETAQAVSQRSDRRFGPMDIVWRTGYGWFGCLPAPRSDWQTDEDYERALARGDAE